MKLFITKLIICIMIFAAFDTFIGFVCDKLFTDIPIKNSETSIIYRSLFTEKTGVLVLGSSTANHHYNTKILSERFESNTFNAGMDGRDLIYADLVLQAFIERDPPKYVIIDIGKGNVDGRFKKRISCVRHYYGRSDVVTNYYNTKSNWQQRLKLLSNTYRYNGTLHSFISLFIGESKPDTSFGYRPLYGNNSFSFYTSNDFTPDAEVLSHLNNIVKTCKENDIHLVLVKSPYCENNPVLNKWTEEYCRNNNVHIIMENTNEYWQSHPELFYDGSHLNSNGADLFTNRVCDIILSSYHYNP